MKIAITADPEIPIPPKLYGGIERIVFMLIERLTDIGHEVVLFAHQDSNVPCKLIPYPSDGNELKSLLLNSLTINKTLFSQSFDLIHSFGRLAYLIPQMPRRMPILMSYQREPTIAQVKKAVNLSAANTIAFTGCSDYITNRLKPFAEAATIYNGVDIRKYEAVMNIDQDAPLIFLGRIEAIKGTHTAIEIANMAGKKLIIAGNIPAQEQRYFDEAIRPLLNDRITYAGAVDDEQKNTLLGQSLALLMPIHWDEPFGIVMAEAMACGTPVIGFNRGAVPEVIINGINGFIASNASEAAGKINLLNQIDRALVRRHAENKFNFDIITQQYLTMYSALINA